MFISQRVQSDANNESIWDELEHSRISLTLRAATSYRTRREHVVWLMAMVLECDGQMSACELTEALFFAVSQFPCDY